MSRGFPEYRSRNQAADGKIILERLGTSQDVEIVNDYAPAEIEEMFEQYAGTGHVVLTIDRHERVDAEVRHARTVCGGLLDIQK